MIRQELQGLFDTMVTSLEEAKRLVRQYDRHTYERWAAGGFLIDDSIMSMYPSLQRILEEMGEEEETSEEDEEEMPD